LADDDYLLYWNIVSGASRSVIPAKGLLAWGERETNIKI